MCFASMWHQLSFIDRFTSTGTLFYEKIFPTLNVMMIVLEMLLNT